MEFQEQGAVVMNIDQFCPLQHPNEPAEEDQPMKCPIPASCPTQDNEAREEKLSCENLRRKAKLLEVMDQTATTVLQVGRERPRRAVRRRFHSENTAATPTSSGYPFQQPNSLSNFQKTLNN